MGLSPSLCIALVSVSTLLFHEIVGKPDNERSITEINFDLYHHRDALLQEVKSLAIQHPQNILVESLKSESDGYVCEIIVATVAQNVRDHRMDNKYRLLLSFGQHGRELITSEVALKLLRILVSKNDLSVPGNGTLQEFQNLIIKVVPMENYNGRKLVEDGQLCERKNGRAVDINRNWSVDWGEREQDFDPSEEFPGTAPFSEPETRIIRDLAKTFRPHLWINVHSGMQAMFMPYDFKNALPDPKVAEPMKKLLHRLNYLHCNGNCVIGPGGGSVGYLAHGTASDYMFEVLEIPLAFTFEIYGDPNTSDEDCFRMFNPTTPALFESTITQWCLTFITIFVELEAVLKSLPTSKTGGKNSFYTFRKELTRHRVFHAGQQWNSETRTLLELIILVSISYLGIISYMFFRGQHRFNLLPWFYFIQSPAL